MKLQHAAAAVLALASAALGASILVEVVLPSSFDQA